MRRVRKVTDIFAPWTGFLVILLPTLSFAVNPSDPGQLSAPVNMISCGHASVWDEPETIISIPRLETQLEQGEPVIVHEIRGGWALIEAVEQREFTHNGKWEGYPGWVRSSDLCAGTSGIRYVTDGLRQGGDLIFSTAKGFIGIPYLWGGIPDSSEDRGSAAGIDCSGLVFYSYRAHGRLVPRDAHEQWMMARPIFADELRPGDLIFSAKMEAPGKVTHVMIYVVEDEIIEAKYGEDINRTRTITAAERFGVPLKGLSSGTVTGEVILYFGTFRALRPGLEAVES